MKTIFEDGQQVHDWKVIKFDCVDERRHRRYICECKCGFTTSLVASRLASGKTKHCTNCKRMKLEGRTFYDWEVLSYHGTDKHSKSLWKCRCKCGKEEVVSGNNLVKGGSTCCFDCGHNKAKGTIHIPAAFWHKTKTQAKIRGHNWNITEEEAYNKLEEQKWTCALTGLKLSFGSSDKDRTASIDRVDSAKPYTASNIQWVHKHINIMKHTYSQSYFIKMCQLVSKNKRLDG